MLEVSTAQQKKPKDFDYQINRGYFDKYSGWITVLESNR
jgi:hypothetical protein